MDRLKRYQRAHATLRYAVIAVCLYGSSMVLAGRTVAGMLFDAFGFGPTSHSLDSNGESYAVFCFGIIGSVIAGWMFALHALLDLCDAPAMIHRSIRQSARRGIFVSAIFWFVVDTSFSIVIVEYNHALFNIPFIMLLMIPLYVMHQNEDVNEVLLDTNVVTNNPTYGSTK
jgi:hypothetical protein